MPRRKFKTNSGTIHRYFTRSGVQNSENLNMNADSVSDSDSTGEKSVGNMAAKTHSEPADAVSNNELKSLLVNLERKMTDSFSNLEEKVESVTERIGVLEIEVSAVKSAQSADRSDFDKLQQKVEDLERSLLQTQVHSRKYNLLFYGVDGNDTTTEDTISRLRRFGTESLKLGEDFVKRITFRNAHRLQKRNEGPAAIIAVFLHWTEREAFLRAGKNLKKTKMSVRTDLPPQLKQKRGELATMAYRLRNEEHLQTFIRERGTDVWLETRRNANERWMRQTN